MKLSITKALILGMIALLWSCHGATDDRLTVAVSIPPQKAILEQIVGDKAKVVTIIQPGSNPESFEPGMSTLMEIEKSAGYITVGGLPFESSLSAKIHSNNPNLPIGVSSASIDLIYGTHDNCGHHHHQDGDTHHHSSPDPHIWSSVRNVIAIARDMAEFMAKIDPENADYYRINARDYIDNHLAPLDAKFSDQLDSAGVKSFVIWHPSLSYFARDYGIEQIAIGQESKESSVKQLKRQIDEAREHHAEVFFFQTDYDTRQAKTVNNQLGTKLVTINPMNEDWEKELTDIVNALCHTDL